MEVKKDPVDWQSLAFHALGYVSRLVSWVTANPTQLRK